MSRTESFFDLNECAECGCQLPKGCGGVFRGGDSCPLPVVDEKQRDRNLAIADGLLEGDAFLQALMRAEMRAQA